MTRLLLWCWTPQFTADFCRAGMGGKERGETHTLTHRHTATHTRARTSVPRAPLDVVCRVGKELMITRPGRQKTMTRGGRCAAKIFVCRPEEKGRRTRRTRCHPNTLPRTDHASGTFARPKTGACRLTLLLPSLPGHSRTASSRAPHLREQKGSPGGSRRRRR